MNRRTLIAATLVLAACGPEEEDPLREIEPEEVTITAFEPRRAALVTQPIDVAFSRTLVGPSEVGVDIPAEDLLVISPALPGRARWISQDTLRFIPEASFADGSRYRVQVRPGVVGEGRVLVGNSTFEFPTRMFTLESIEVRPRPEARTARVVLAFSHPVRPAEASAAVSFRRRDGRTVPARILTAEVGPLMTFLLGPLSGDFASISADVQVDGSLRATTGGRPLEKNIVRPLDLSPEPILRVEEVEAFQIEERLGVRVRWNRTVDAASIRNVLTVRPEVPFEVLTRHHGFEVVGGFRSAQTYTLTLEPGIESSDGFVLPEAVSLPVTMPSLAPALHLTREKGPLELLSVNVARVELRVTKVWDDNVAHLLPFLGQGVLPEQATFGPVVYRADLETAGRTDEVVSTVVPYVDPMLRRAGLYLVEVVDAERAWVRANAWVFDNGLTLTAKVGASIVRAEVLSQATLRPVYAAEVRIVSRTNRTLGTARTDTSGVAEIVVDTDPEDPPAWVMARRATAFAYLPLPQTQTIPKHASSGVVRGRAHVFGDRSTYLAGEVVRLGMIVRTDALRPASGAPPTLEVRGPLGALLEPARVGRVVDGASIHELTLPVDAPDGRYDVRAVGADGQAIGRHRFWVEELSPPRLVADVRIDGDVEGARTPAFVVEAKYRLGRKAASGLVLRTRCRYREQPLVFEGFEGFVFKAASTRALDLVESEVESRLDERGAGRRWCPAVRSAGATGPVKITLEAAVLEPGGRVVTNEASATHRPTAHSVGVRTDPAKGPASVGEDASLQIVVVDAEGRPVANVPVTATVRSLDGAAAPVEVTSASGEGPVDIPYVTREPGRHRVDVETKGGAATSLTFWVIPDVGSNVPAPGGELVVVAPGTPVGVGEEAELLVWAPFEGRLDLTVERERVLWRKNVDLDAHVSRVTVPVLASFAPNAYVVARIASGRRSAYASAPLGVSTRPHRLKTELSTADSATAGQPLRVRVRARDQAGDPVRGHAIVWAVKATRLDPSYDRAADPTKHFVGLQPLSLTTHDLSSLDRALAAPRHPAPRDRRPRVEWDDAPSVWSTIVPLDGEANVTVALPFIHGPTRVAAVVFADDRFGAAHRTIDVKDPLRLRTRMPRMLRPKDRLEIPVEVENGLDRVVDVRLSVRTEGPVRVGERSKALRLEPDGSETVMLGLEVDEAIGPARIAIGGSTGTSSSAVERRFTIEPSRPRTILGISGEASRLSPLELPMPTDFLRGSARVALTVGPTPLYRYRAALDAVLGAPRSDRSAVHEVLALTFASRLLDKSEPRVSEAIARLTSSTGGRDGRATTLYGLALFEAARVRHIDRAALERTHQRLYGLVTSDAAIVEPMIRALAHFVLALAERPDRKGLIALADAWEEPDAPVDPHVRAILAAALMRAGMTTRGRRMLADDLPLAPGLEALLLTVIAEVHPFHPLVDRLVDALERRTVDGHWPTREEDALALVGIAKYSRRAAPDPPYWGSVLLDGEVEKRFNTKRSVVLETNLDEWRSKTLRFEITGSGTAYIGLSTRGVSAGDQATSSEGLEVERAYFTIAGAPVEGPVDYGELVVAKLRVRCTATVTCGRVVVDERIPAGLDLEDPNLTGLDWLTRGAGRPRSEAREDRLTYEVDLDEGEEANAYYTARAIAVGSFGVPAVVVRATRRPDLSAVAGAGRLEVRASP